MMPSIVWTEFQSASADTKREVAQEWADLIGHIAAAPVFEDKASCPWIKLARFGANRSGGGSLRNNRNVIEITGVEGDYDAGAVSPEHAVLLLERAGIKAVVYTSPRHHPQSPRWRVLAPLAKPHKPEARSALLARINGALGGILSSESFTLSQSYYYGRVKGQPEYKVLTTFDDAGEGQFIDELDDLDEIAVVSRALPEGSNHVPPSHAISAAVEHLGRRLHTGDSRRELLRSYISDKSRRGLDVDEIMALVDLMAERFFDPSDPIDRTNVRKIAADFVQADYLTGNSASTVFGKEDERLSQLLLNLVQLREASRAISWSVKHVLPADSVGVMFGGSGTFKSFIALDLALHMAHGMPWCGKKTKRAPVIYIAAEGGAGLWRRIEAWHKDRRLSFETIEFYVVPVSLDLIQDSAAVVRAAEAVGVVPGLVVVDTMSQTFSGEENSANEVANYLRVLGTCFRHSWRAAVLVIHHSGHQATERPRGSSAIRANVDYMFGVFRDEKEMLARVECHKQKDGDQFSEMPFRLDSIQLGFDEDGDPVTSLVATYIATDEELQSRKDAEAARGSGGHERVLLSLAQVGMEYEALRMAFYDTFPDGVNTHTKKTAMLRAWGNLERKGLVSKGRDPKTKLFVVTHVTAH